jgi:hypothetical protein
MIGMARRKERPFPEGLVWELGDHLDLALLLRAFPFLALAERRGGGLRFARFAGVGQGAGCFLLRQLDPDAGWVPSGRVWHEHLSLKRGVISWSWDHGERWIGPFADVTELAALDLYLGIRAARRRRVARLYARAQARLRRRQAPSLDALRGADVPRAPTFSEPALVKTSREFRVGAMARWLQDRAGDGEPAWFGPVAFAQALFMVPIKVADDLGSATAIGARALRLPFSVDGDEPCVETVPTPDAVARVILSRASIAGRLVPDALTGKALLAARAKLLEEQARLPERQDHARTRYSWRLRREAENLVVRLRHASRMRDAEHAWRVAMAASFGPARRAKAWLRRRKAELTRGASVAEASPPIGRLTRSAA